VTVLTPPATRPTRAEAPPAPSGRAGRDAAVRLGALAALWLAMLLVSWWWATGGGFQDLAGWESGLTSLGRLTGLLASVLLLAQVLLWPASRCWRARSAPAGCSPRRASCGP
jgi:hypothetical protein